MSTLFRMFALLVMILPTVIGLLLGAILLNKKQFDEFEKTIKGFYEWVEG